MSKDARRAILIAKRGGFASGGIPLLGEPAVEVITNEYHRPVNDDQPEEMRPTRPTRDFVPMDQAPHVNLPTHMGPPLKPGIGHNQPPSPMVQTRVVPPVFKSVTHGLLTDPKSLGGMKHGTPQQWVNKLLQAGAKKEELSWTGVGEGSPNQKISREDMADRVQKNLPKLKERVLGNKGKERVLIAGDPDAEQDMADTHLDWGDWETEEPDDSYMRERAQEYAPDHIKDNVDDPDWAEDYDVPGALQSFAEKYLHGEGLPHERMEFAKIALDHGWITPGQAQTALRPNRDPNSREKDWEHLTGTAAEAAADEFNDKDALHSHPTLPGLEAPPRRPETADYFAAFNHAVQKVNPGADVMEHFKEHLEENEKLLEHLEQGERDSYYNDDESPSTATVTVRGGNDEPGYTVRRSYGEYHIESPEGRDVGTTHRRNEAENLIHSHAMDNYDLNTDSENAPRYETRDIPQNNMTVPVAEASAPYESYGRMAGMENYRELPIEFEPKEGEPDFTRSHHGQNVLGHALVGDFTDDAGRRLLHVSEGQSDLHQKGADEGYFDKGKQTKAQAEYEEAKKELGKQRKLLMEKLGLPSGDQESLENPDIHHPADRLARSLQQNNSWARSEFTEVADKLPKSWMDQHLGEDWQNMPYRDLHDKFNELAQTRFHLGSTPEDLRLHRNHTVDLSRAAAKSGIPNAPFKESGDFGRFMFRHLLRKAAEYGYHGISLNPGWVVSDRYGQNHNHLYDNVFRGALEGVAKEANHHMGTNLKREEVTIPYLRTHGDTKGENHHGGKAHAILFHNEENREKVKNNSFPLFKRGGFVPRKKRASGGRLMPPPQDWNQPPIVSDEPIHEAIMQGPEGAERRWVPQSQLEHPALAAKTVVSAKPAAPLLKSKVEDLLMNHDLDAKKVGNVRTPAEWGKVLQKYGAKPAEINQKGVTEGTDKISREALLNLVRDRRWPIRQPKLMNHPYREEVTPIDYDPYAEGNYTANFEEGDDPLEWNRETMPSATKSARIEALKAGPEAKRALEDPASVLNRMRPDDHYGYLKPFLSNFLLAKNTSHPQDVRDNFRYDGRFTGGGGRFFNPSSLDPKRVEDFANDMVSRGYSDPRHAATVVRSAKAGDINLNEWNTFVHDLSHGVYDAMIQGAGHNRKLDSGVAAPTQHGFPDFLPQEEDSDRATVTGIIKPFEDAVRRLRGLSKDDTNVNLLGDLKDHIKTNLLYTLAEKVENDWHNDPLTPRKGYLKLSNNKAYGRTSRYKVRYESRAPGDIEHEKPKLFIKGYDYDMPEQEGESPEDLKRIALEYAKAGQHLTPAPEIKRIPLPMNNISSEVPEGSPEYGNYKLEKSTNPAVMPFFVGNTAAPVATGFRHSPHYNSHHVNGTDPLRRNTNIMHGRTSDVTSEDGRRILFGEEAQADAQQHGAKHGYLPWTNTEEAKKKAGEERDAIKPAIDKANSAIAHILSLSGPSDEHNRYAANHLSRVLAARGFDRDVHQAINSAAEYMSTADKERLFGTRYLGDEPTHILMSRLREKLSSLEGRDEAIKASKDIGSLKKRESKLHSLARGYAMPPIPWQDSSDWGKVILKSMLRRAADFGSHVHPEGYHGFALSPGWVQARRWGYEKSDVGQWNQGHFQLYNTILAKALKEVAAEKGLTVAHMLIPELKHEAEMAAGRMAGGDENQKMKEFLLSPAAHHAPAIDFDKHPRDLIEKISREPFNEYKRGGAAKAPTEAQKEAGNYKKKHISFQGLDIAIENEKGSERSGVDPGGKRWSVKMPADYGYIKQTKGADGDHVDAYIGPDKSSTHVFIINQCDHRTGKFDEHKCILGCRSEKEALALYVAGFSDGKGRARAASMESMSLDAFKHWLKRGDTTKKAKAPDIVHAALKLTGKYVYKH